jgi:ankyrin repeat protein
MRLVGSGSVDIELAQVLPAAGADVNALPGSNYGATALQLSSIKGYIGITMMFLEAGAEVNAKGAVVHGRMALEGAAEHGRIDTVKLLLDAGVTLSGSRDGQYMKSLELASQNGYTAVKELIENCYRSKGH